MKLFGPYSGWGRAPLVLVVPALLIAGGTAVAIVTNFAEVDLVHDPAAVHVDQQNLRNLVAGGQRDEAFTEAFELGDELFGTSFNALDGSGANVGRGQRFTRVPRADLRGAGEWLTHTPERVTGPNAQGCFECHEAPFEDGAGTAAQNVHRDPFRTGLVSHFVTRNTPHVFAIGALQRLAEEMTDELGRDQLRLQELACAQGGTQSVPLTAKGVSFGTLSATRTSVAPCQLSFDTSAVSGVDFQPSVENPASPIALIVRPFQWKGSVAFVRDFNRGASHNELGMQAVEVVGDNVDGDHDGVANEMTIGDQTALAIYMAAQPRPTSLLELQALGLLDPPLNGAQIARIIRGLVVFQEVGCGSCHLPVLTIDNPTFSEPSQNEAFRDGAAFPAGQSTIAAGVDPRFAVTFDLTRDQPDNHIALPGGRTFNLGALRRDLGGRALVELFGDLKRHVMGPRLAEPVNEIAGDDVTPIPPNPLNRHTPDTFMTENLWGVGSTAPYMHDGRATTIAEAILEHATDQADDPSEAAPARRNYLARSAEDKQALIALLENLVLFKLEEEEEGETAAATSALTQLVTGPREPRTKIGPKGFRIRIARD
jgi:Di-haem oxidoreductase, putative peroxidase